MNNLGELALKRCDWQVARCYFANALALHQAIHYQEGTALSWYYLGYVSDACHEPDVQHYFYEALQQALVLNMAWLVVFFLPGIARHLARVRQSDLAIKLPLG